MQKEPSCQSHRGAIFAVISLSLVLNSALKVEYASRVRNEPLEYKLPNAPQYSGKPDSKRSVAVTDISAMLS
ncbi:UNVERIFIED_ORG: hypothetical protein QFZ59_002669 [Bacillus sp. B2I3]|nr:hypothetical protein [Bacillus sp. B2I3]